MVCTLDIHPAFGFENMERWEVAVHQRDHYIRANGGNPGNSHHRAYAQLMGFNNLSKVASYIPILNVVVGVQRIFINIFDETEDPVKKAICESHITRGFAEICFGPLMVLPDILTTLYEKTIVDTYKETHPDL